MQIIRKLKFQIYMTLLSRKINKLIFWGEKKNGLLSTVNVIKRTPPPREPVQVSVDSTE